MRVNRLVVESDVTIIVGPGAAPRGRRVLRRREVPVPGPVGPGADRPHPLARRAHHQRRDHRQPGHHPRAGADPRGRRMVRRERHASVGRGRPRHRGPRSGGVRRPDRLVGGRGRRRRPVPRRVPRRARPTGAVARPPPLRRPLDRGEGLLQGRARSSPTVARSSSTPRTSPRSPRCTPRSTTSATTAATTSSPSGTGSATTRGASSPTRPTCSAPGPTTRSHGEHQRVQVDPGHRHPRGGRRTGRTSSYLDPASVDLAAWEADPDALVVPDAGEVLYRLRSDRGRASRDQATGPVDPRTISDPDSSTVVGSPSSRRTAAMPASSVGMVIVVRGGADELRHRDVIAAHHADVLGNPHASTGKPGDDA